MFSIPVFTNAFFRASGEVGLHLVDGAATPPWSSRDARRARERLQTFAFVNDAMEESGVSSTYALEALLMRGLPDVVFPDDRPKLCDRMARIGQPAVVKQLSTQGQKDARTQRWFRRLVDLAPAAVQIPSHPLWRLLNPVPIDHLKWFELAGALGEARLSKLEMTGGSIAPGAAWRVIVRASDTEEECEYYVPYLGHSPDRAVLTDQLLQLRRWEALGNLVAYDLALQQTIRVASHLKAAKDLAVLQPHLGSYLVQCFGTVLIPHPELNVAMQRRRIESGRKGWEKRVLMGTGVGMPGYDAWV